MMKYDGKQVNLFNHEHTLILKCNMRKKNKEIFEENHNESLEELITNKANDSDF